MRPDAPNDLLGQDDTPCLPSRCHHCGKLDVVPITTEYQASVRHDGRLHTFTISALQIACCQACGERVFTEKVDEQVNDALRAHLKLLTPTQIRDALKRVGLSQKDAAKRLGIAEATLSRWLNQTQIQSRAMDNLLRVFITFPEVSDFLAEDALGFAAGLACNTSNSLGYPQHVVRCLSPSVSWPNGTDQLRDACRSAQDMIQLARTTWGGRRAG